ncbi:hypothetical protein COI51_16305 [Bacillus toyonensis]|nr:hypothetical protein COM06_01770 [Bacillus toyonensis]PGC34592.1 hypothetical protein COM10_19950 [Bacillus toyonensis]PHF83383.1 hypothetical protein COI51_16305 [Bacillus toyonensis]PHG01177.1 hypothetical protein COI49_19735 [Bacillus toyonensis]
MYIYSYRVGKQFFINLRFFFGYFKIKNEKKSLIDAIITISKPTLCGGSPTHDEPVHTPKNRGKAINANLKNLFKISNKFFRYIHFRKKL